jgi:hypothetical protein
MKDEGRYLGDGLYASDEGFQFRLWASNGRETTNEVYLEDGALQGFFRFIEDTRGVKIKVTKVAQDDKDPTK